MKYLLLLSKVLLAFSCAQAQTQTPTPNKSPWQRVTTFSEPKLKEISGLAPSQKSKQILWAHNDSGGKPELHALDLSGKFLGSVALQGVDNKDWEDLCAFQQDGTAYLLVADTGDNVRERLSVHCHIVKEPTPSDVQTAVAWTQSIRYQDGPQDCESVAVYQDHIYLLNKDKGASVIYTAPLGAPGDSATVIATKLVVLPQIGNAADSLAAVLKAGLLGTQATALDISSDGQWAAALTYTDVRLFKRKHSETWRETFARTPQVIALPNIYQPEALCFSTDSKSLYVSSEESPTPIVRFALPHPD